MTAAEAVLLRYRGGEVYAVPEAHAGGLALRLALRVAGVRVAVTSLEPCPVWSTVGGFETGGTLTDLVAAGEHHRRMAREAAEHARVTPEMERAPRRPARRTGKAKAKGRAER